MIVIVGLIYPFTSRIANNLELMNETFTLLTIYHLFLFTDVVRDVAARELVGKSLIGITCMNVGLNFGFITLLNLVLLSRKTKLAFLKWRQAQRFKVVFKERFERARLNRIKREQQARNHQKAV